MYEAARRPDAPRYFGKVFTRVLLVYTGLGLGLCLIAEEVVALLGGGRYLSATAIIAPIVLAYFFQTAADLMDAGFYITRKTTWKLPIMLASTAVMLLLYALLIPTWGIGGAGGATLLGFAFMAWLTLEVSQRAFAVQYEWGRLLGMLLSAVLGWLIGRVLPAELWSLPVKAGLWLGWLAVQWWTVFSEEEKHWILASCGLAGRTAKPQAASRAA
jgi:O-antigen/teichoic acid export membrane protein